MEYATFISIIQMIGESLANIFTILDSFGLENPTVTLLDILIALWVFEETVDFINEFR